MPFCTLNVRRQSGKSNLFVVFDDFSLLTKGVGSLYFILANEGASVMNGVFSRFLRLLVLSLASCCRNCSIVLVLD